MKRVRILITPKKGLLDPQGRAVEEMLQDQGYDVKDVIVGKLVEMYVKEDTDVKTLVEKFIVNPLVEDYRIEEF